MFEHVQVLPGTQRHSSADHRNGKTRLRERGTDVRGHIIVALRRVPIPGISLRREPFKEIAQIEYNVRVGILLNQQRCGGVLNENGKQTS